jgi:DNA-binding transcriptional MerR regulator
MNRTARPARPTRPKASRPAQGGAEAGSGGERLLKIGETAALLGVETYVLRFWETQFPFLRPRHTRSKHRFYSAKDIETLKLIKRLLHQERFTIAGAKKYIREVGLDRALEGGKPAAPKAPAVAVPAQTGSTRSESGIAVRHTLAEVRRELESLHKLLDR